MPEDEYQKLREEWYKNKRARFIKYETPKREKAVKNFQKLGKGTRTTRKKYTPKPTDPKPIELLNTPQNLKSTKPSFALKSIENTRKPMEINKDSQKQRKNRTMRDILDDNFISESEKADELEKLLKSSNVSQVQAYGINKQIKAIRAKIARELRQKNKQVEQMNLDL